MLLKSPGLPINKVVLTSSCPLPLLPPIIHPCPLSPFAFSFLPHFFCALINWTTPLFYTFSVHKNYIHPYPAPHPPHFHFFLHYLWLSFYHKSLPPLSPNILLYFSMPLTSCMTYPIPLSLPWPHPPSFPLFLNHLWMLHCHQGQIRHREAW